ncbi:MAG: amino acid adenylation domain-containing protein [Eubacterium sp.]|nr:amino acid adenylation domain-containing protein [Eubacterium sp.]
MDYKIEQLIEDIEYVSGLHIEDVTKSLIEQGLGSLHIMKLANKWRKEGSAVTFAKLISSPKLDKWVELVNVRRGKKKKETKETSQDRYAPYDLTDIQYAYYVGRQKHQVLGNVSCHAYMEIIGNGIDAKRLNESWKKLLCHHPMLHTAFDENGKQYEVKDFKPEDIEVHDYRAYDETKAEQALLKVRETRSHLVRDIEHGKNAGLALTLLPDGRSVMHYDIDLLAADVQSFQKVLEDLAALYQGETLPETSKDFCFAQYLRQANQKDREEYARAQQFWEEKLESMPDRPQLPLRVRAEEVKDVRFATRSFIFPKKEWESFKEIARCYELTPAMGLLTLYAQVLERWSANKKFVVNLPIFNRNTQYPGSEEAVADFSNVLLVETDQSEHQSFVDAAKKMQEQFHENMTYAGYSGIEVVRKLSLKHDKESCPAPVVFACNLGEPLISKRVGECFGQLNYMLSQTPQVWIDYQMYDYGDGELFIKWDSVDELFPEKLVDKMFGAYVEAFHSLAGGAKIWEQELVIALADKENEAMRYRHRMTKEVAPRNLLDEFLKIVKNTPSNLAIVRADTGEEMSYGQLYDSALKIATRLLEGGMQPGENVAVTLKKSPMQIVAVVGALLAGGCYVPIGVRQPAQRREKIYQSAKVRYVITDRESLGEMDAKDRYIICVEEAMKIQAQPQAVRLGAPDEQAYIIFTSGSTGQPKGVVITHQAAWNTIADLNERYRVTSKDRILAVSALDFDLSVYDIFGMLSSGATLVTIEEEDARDAEKWLSYVNRYRITMWNSVPAILDMLLGTAQTLNSKMESLRRVFLSGDWIGLELPKKLQEYAPNAFMTAMGGATEASIWSNYYEVTLPLDPKWTSIPYGKPLTNQCFNVVDEKGNGCPQWVSGELYIGGAGLAKEYCNEPELTQKQFTIEQDGQRWYHTGDLGRFREDGLIEFLGRKDDQVKVRGHRIELGEIETALKESNLIHNGVVDTITDEHGTKHLIAFVIMQDQSLPLEEAKEAMKAYLGEKVPYYMVPELYHICKKLPLSANGKVDRKALRQMDVKLELQEEKTVKEARTKTEKTLVTIWEKTLQVRAVSRDDSFFELGGDSLLAVKLNNEMKEIFHANVSLKDIFNHPVLCELAAILDEREKGAEQKETPSVLLTHDEEHRYEPFPVTAVQKAYFLGEKSVYEYGNISTHYYFEMMLESLDTGRLEQAVNKVIETQDMLHAVVSEDGERQQVLKYYPTYRIQEYDATTYEPQKKQDLIMYVREEMAHEHFNSSHLPLFDIRVIQVDNGARVNLCFNNIVFDGYSIFLFFELVTKCYQDDAFNLAQPGVTFRDYLLMMEKDKESKKYQEDKEYWMNRLDTLAMAPELPTAGGDEEQVNRLSHTEYVLDRARWTQLKNKISAIGGITPTGFLISLYTEVLNRWSKTKRFTINLTHFNRRKVHEDIDRIIGDFTSLTMLETDFSKQDTFVNRCKNLQQQLWEDLDHASFDGVEVERELIRKKKLKTPVFPYVFTSALGLHDADNMFTNRLYSCSETPQVWLDHQVSEDQGNLMLALDYRKEQFPDGMVDDLWENYCRTLEAIIKDESLWTKQVPNICAYEYPKNLSRGNDTKKELPTHLLHTKIVEAYEKNPKKTAVVDREKAYSYEDIVLMASAVAEQILSYTKGEAQCVAVIMPKSVYQVYSVVGVLGAGCAYAPIDDGNDIERKKYIIQNAKIKTVLTLSSNTEEYEGCNVICVDALQKAKSCSLQLEGDEDACAYIIHTSGSTGVPKGVVISHAGAVNTIEDVNERFHVGKEDTAIGLSQLYFDLSVYDIFGLLSVGGTLVYPSKERYMDPSYWHELVQKYKVTIWNSVPAFMQMYVDYLSANQLEWSGVKSVLLSGDWIGLELFPAIKKMSPATTCMSLGGATEASIWSIWYEYQKMNETWNSIPYGKAMANQQFYVLDEDLNERPMMVEGELYIGGDGLAIGYLNNEDETAKRFVINPRTGQRLYKTGDLGRVMDDGNIEFLGREDTQVKILGFRIELGEIDSVISKMDGVLTSVSLALELGGSSKKLYSYVQTGQDTHLKEDELKEKLVKKLPKYMLPTKIVFTKELPLTSNGKINRKEIGQIIKEQSEQEIEEEQPDCQCDLTPTEQVVLEVMKKALKVPHISMEDDFYDLGADSLIMGNAATELVNEFEEKVPFYEILSTLLNEPDIKSAAELIDTYLEEDMMTQKGE